MYYLTLLVSISLQSVNVEGLDISAAKSTLISDADYENMLSQISEMGYDREKAKSVLLVSFNNSDRAVEYLLTNQLLPENESQNESSPVANIKSSNNVSIPTGEAAEALAFLRLQPQFQLLKQVIQQHPQLLDAALQQMGEQNPQLLLLVCQYKEEFVRMLKEPSSAIGTGETPTAPVSSGVTTSINIPIGAVSDNMPSIHLESEREEATSQVSLQDREAIE